ncbi:MAG: type II toxin-antitoxin system death-on-curing family toxin [Planctomycetota bacterium]|nr:type II toxin-antitoxin system death-on-curing family toxin [Planctomycetota bacterium]
MRLEFLRIEDVLYLHRKLMERYGGEWGVRDPGLIDSAVAQARSAFGGTFLHGDHFEMAAAYHYHIVRNHPFVDGNKRTGAVAALTFLDWNGVRLRADVDGLVDITLRVASGKAGKRELAAFSALSPSSIDGS